MKCVGLEQSGYCHHLIDCTLFLHDIAEKLQFEVTQQPLIQLLILIHFESYSE
jgi:hypothetical protein